MKTNYSLKRIEQLENIMYKLYYRKQNKYNFTEKETRLQRKLFMCVISQDNKLSLQRKLFE